MQVPPYQSRFDALYQSFRSFTPVSYANIPALSRPDELYSDLSVFRYSCLILRLIHNVILQIMTPAAAVIKDGTLNSSAPESTEKPPFAIQI